VVKNKGNVSSSSVEDETIIERDQELKRKMTELQYSEKECMEAQVEEEKATASLEIYKQAEDENEIGNVERGDNIDTGESELCYLNKGRI